MIVKKKNNNFNILNVFIEFLLNFRLAFKMELGIFLWTTEIKILIVEFFFIES